MELYPRIAVGFHLIPSLSRCPADAKKRSTSCYHYRMIPSNNPSPTFQRSSRLLLTNLFLKHENTEQPSMALVSEMSLTEFREFQKVISDKGNMTNNAANIKMQIANFISRTRQNANAAVQPSGILVKQKGGSSDCCTLINNGSISGQYGIYKNEGVMVI